MVAKTQSFYYYYYFFLLQGGAPQCHSATHTVHGTPTVLEPGPQACVLPAEQLLGISLLGGVRILTLSQQPDPDFSP